MFTKEISDIDECTANVHDCDEHASCTNVRGSFNCKCDDRYIGNGTNCLGNICDGEYCHNN